MSGKITKSVLDLLFPRFCLNCRVSGTYACNKCLSALPLLNTQVCPNCRKATNLGKFCSEKCSEDFYFDQLIVGLNYDKDSFVKKIIVRFKYNFSRDLSVSLATILVAQLEHFFGDFRERKDSIFTVPVPIHLKKMKKRGFNQSILLCGFVSDYFGFCMTDCLLRLDFREDQAKLKRKERLENLKGNIGLCSCYEEGMFKGKFVFLVDDVATTGSTLNECSKVLKECGAEWICGLVIARGR